MRLPILCLLAFAAVSPAGAVAPFHVERVRAWLDPLRSLQVSPKGGAPPVEAWRAAVAGEVVHGVVEAAGGGPPGAWAVAVLEVSMEDAWAAVNDEAGLAAEAWGGRGATVSGAPCADGRRSLVTMPVPLALDRWWVVRYRHAADLHRASQGRVRELSWQEVPDGHRWVQGQPGDGPAGVEVPVSRGAWLLVTLDEGHTLIEYWSRVDPGGMLPSGAAAAFASSTLKRTLEVVEARARSRRTRCHEAAAMADLEEP